jgi:high-affinity nickel-transport protein
MDHPAALVAAGFLLGVRHAMDADHVLVVTTLVRRERRVAGAAVVGLLWGVGHTATVGAVGAAAVALGLRIPVRAGLALELLAAVMLVALGGLAVRGSWLDGRRGRSSPHAHGDYVHRHGRSAGPDAHAHPPEGTPLARLDRVFGRRGAYRALRPLVVGGVHGLAGSAGIALLVLGAIPDPRWALGYLAVFGAGTIAGMMALTAAIAAPFTWAAARAPALQPPLGLASGVLGVAGGLVLASRVGGLVPW